MDPLWQGSLRRVARFCIVPSKKTRRRGRDPHASASRSIARYACCAESAAHDRGGADPRPAHFLAGLRGCKRSRRSKRKCALLRIHVARLRDLRQSLLLIRVPRNEARLVTAISLTKIPLPSRTCCECGFVGYGILRLLVDVREFAIRSRELRIVADQIFRN